VALGLLLSPEPYTHSLHMKYNCTYLDLPIWLQVKIFADHSSNRTRKMCRM
jgi:hypothetical protein